MKRALLLIVVALLATLFAADWCRGQRTARQAVDERHLVLGADGWSQVLADDDVQHPQHSIRADARYQQAVTSQGGVLLDLDVDGRIRDAVAQEVARGGRVLQDVHAIGPHGQRAVVLDSEDNRIALHSGSDG